MADFNVFCGVMLLVPMWPLLSVWLLVGKQTNSTTSDRQPQEFTLVIDWCPFFSMSQIWLGGVSTFGYGAKGRC